MKNDGIKFLANEISGIKPILRIVMWIFVILGGISLLVFAINLLFLNVVFSALGRAIDASVWAGMLFALTEFADYIKRNQTYE